MITYHSTKNVLDKVMMIIIIVIKENFFLVQKPWANQFYAKLELE